MIPDIVMVTQFLNSMIFQDFAAIFPAFRGDGCVNIRFKANVLPVKANVQMLVSVWLLPD